MKLILIAFLILLLPKYVCGQYNETIRSGRPGQSIGPYTVGKNVFQLQTGLVYNQIENGTIKTKLLSESTVLRFGILERIELSTLISWEKDEIDINGIDEKKQGISSTQIGGRINILVPKGAVPAVALQGRVLLKAQNHNFKSEKIGSKFVLATGNKVSDWLSIITNWGVTWDGNDSDPKSLYTLNTSFGLSGKLSWYVEMYGSFNDFSANFDSGIAYLVNNDLQLDLSGGWQGSDDVSDWLIDFGLSWRFDWRK